MYSDEDTLAGGLPHSEIPGSTIARISPGLFAACHVLHRLSVPRHPPDALTLRLSATPNGKDHVRWNQSSTVEPERRRGAKSARILPCPILSSVRQILSLPAEPRFRRSEDTLLRQSVPLACRALSALLCNTCRARRSRASPDTATVTQLTSSRLSINNTSPRSDRGAGKGNLGSCCRVASLRHSPGGATHEKGRRKWR
jgi:hypothetical protein